jgi:hypothetical protein
MAFFSGSTFPILVRMEVAPATGSTTTVPRPLNHLFFTNPGTIAAQTVNLPSGPADGEQFVISNIGAITALTVSPSVSGIPAGLTAGQGLMLSYSATMATPGWFVLAS